MDDEALTGYLWEVAFNRGAKFRTEQRGDEWQAEIVRRSSLGTANLVAGVMVAPCPGRRWRDLR